MTDADFKSRVLANVLTAVQCQALATQLGVSNLDLGTDTRLALAHLALAALQYSSVGESNNVLEDILHQMPAPIIK